MIIKSKLTEQSVIDLIRNGEIKPTPVETIPSADDVEKKKLPKPDDAKKNRVPQDGKSIIRINGTPAAESCAKHILNLPQFSKDKWSEVIGKGHSEIGKTGVTSEHADGNAIDWHGKQGIGDPVMQQLANYLANNANKLRVQYVIYAMKIWSSSQGWHTYKMPKGGDPHYNHVHVDFKRNKSKDNTSKKEQPSEIKIHKVVATYKNDLYDMLILNPGKYFSNFRGWILGDDEEKAYQYFIKAINTRRKQLKIDTIYNSKNLSKWDKQNLDNLKYVTDIIGQRIRKEIATPIRIGDVITIPWYYPNPKTGKWYQRKIEFEWDYL
jgi:hypothetical protein